MSTSTCARSRCKEDMNTTNNENAKATDRRCALVEEIRQMADDNDVQLALIGDSPEDHADAIVGYVIAPGDPAVLYDYDKLVETFARQFAEDGKPTEETLEEAREWVDYNVVRSLAYTASDGAVPPLIVGRFEEQERQECDTVGGGGDAAQRPVQEDSRRDSAAAGAGDRVGRAR